MDITYEGGTEQVRQIVHHHAVLRRGLERRADTVCDAVASGVPCQRQVAILFNDITEHVRNEQALRESEDRLKAIIDNLSEGLIVVDPQGEALHWNDAAAQMHHARLPSIDRCPFSPTPNTAATCPLAAGAVRSPSPGPKPPADRCFR